MWKLPFWPSQVQVHRSTRSQQNISFPYSCRVRFSKFEILSVTLEHCVAASSPVPAVGMQPSSDPSSRKQPNASASASPQSKAAPSKAAPKRQPAADSPKPQAKTGAPAPGSFPERARANASVVAAPKRKSTLPPQSKGGWDSSGPEPPPPPPPKTDKREPPVADKPSDDKPAAAARKSAVAAPAAKRASVAPVPVAVGEQKAPTSTPVAADAKVSAAPPPAQRGSAPSTTAPEASEHAVADSKKAAPSSAAVPRPGDRKGSKRIGKALLSRISPETESKRYHAALMAVVSERKSMRSLDHFKIPLPLVAMVRHCSAAAQMHVLHSVLALPTESPQTEHTQILDTGSRPVFDIPNVSEEPYPLARRTVAPPKVVKVQRALTRKERVYAWISDPTSSASAWAVSVLIMGCIAATTGSYCYETMPGVMDHGESLRALWIIETICTSVFTVEFLLRLFTCPSLREFSTNILNFIDLLAILPYYIEMLLSALAHSARPAICSRCCTPPLSPPAEHSDVYVHTFLWSSCLCSHFALVVCLRATCQTCIFAGHSGLLQSCAANKDLGAAKILRVVRLSRIFRVLKLGSRYNKLQIISMVITESKDVLAMLIFLLLLTGALVPSSPPPLCTLFSSLSDRHGPGVLCSSALLVAGVLQRAGAHRAHCGAALPL